MKIGGGLLALILCGCAVEAVKHNPLKAVSDTAPFLRALYFEKAYPKALRIAHEDLRQSVTTEDLRQTVERVKNRLGDLKQVKADSYLQTPGRTIELYFVGFHEKGALYHRIVLIGDESSGYKVSGVWFAFEPYAPHPLRHKFEEDIIIE